MPISPSRAGSAPVYASVVVVAVEVGIRDQVIMFGIRPGRATGSLVVASLVFLVGGCAEQYVSTPMSA